MTYRQDIQIEDDVQTLVLGFYDRVQLDSLLGPIFNEQVQVEWVAHLPLMVDFWSSILLGTGGYKGRPFPKHAVLGLEKEHFSRWLNLFFETVDAHFVGPKAEEAKAKALSIATMFQHKIGQLGVTLEMLD
jgi:hemoglobin